MNTKNKQRVRLALAELEKKLNAMKKMNIINIFICLLFANFSHSQNIKPINRDVSGDKLIAENSIYFFYRSPLSDLGDHNKLFLNIPRINPLIGRRAYECRWEVQDNHIYLTKFDHLSQDEEYIDEVGNVKAYDMPPSPNEVFVQEMENYTNRKFDTNRKMRADWLNGKYRLFAVQQDFFYGKTKEKHKMHIDSLANHQKCFLATFKKGKLLKIEEADKDWKVLKK